MSDMTVLSPENRTSFAHFDKNAPITEGALVTPFRLGCDRSRDFHRGFALVVTLVLMTLLALICVGMLGLSATSLRTVNQEDAKRQAYENARLGLALALGQLQMMAGSDQRIMADGALVDGAEPGALNATGVWQSWAPGFVSDPEKAAPDYDRAKEERFLGWLVSNQDSDAVRERDWARSGALADPQPLFDGGLDGFDLNGGKVPVASAQGDGAFAWAVVQEATKAKVTVAGDDGNEGNSRLAVQNRPGLGLSAVLSEPAGDWDERAVKVSNFSQLQLDGQIWEDSGSVAAGADFTTQGLGLLTDPVHGGLKTDLSLGFELDEAVFRKATWTDAGESFPNPFHADAEIGFAVPASYGGERPLFQPLAGRGVVANRDLDSLVKVEYHFPVAAVPTFHLLRSYYRTPRHLYLTEYGVTAFERAADHIACAPGSVSTGWSPPPGRSMEGVETKPSLRPVMDRVMFLVSATKNEDDILQYVMTPVVTLWNPYNVALEIEGAVAHMWGDIPFRIRWRVFNDGVQVFNKEAPLSTSLARGRSTNPYLFAAITATGAPLSATGSVPVIRFQPGEVRVFAPAQPELQEFVVGGTVRERTVFLKPVDDLDQYSTRGGFLLPTKHPDYSESLHYERKLAQNEVAQMYLTVSTVQDHPFFISLEDATRAKGSNPSNSDRGLFLADVLSRAFTKSGETDIFESARLTFSELSGSPVPVGVIETYHRVARSGSGAQIADLVYTGNPRQPWMNNLIQSGGQFTTGPQYQMRMRKLSSFNELMETQDSGRKSFYGSSHTAAGGRGNLSFFEVPREPLLSLASLQHLELSYTPFSAANVFANSWASAYVPRNRAAKSEFAMDHSHLTNEALWDSYFFSGAAARIDQAAGSGSASSWNQDVANITKSAEVRVRDYVEDPVAAPLDNPRMRLYSGGLDRQVLADRLASEAGPARIAAHLMVDGAFNVNSTKVEAWKAVLSAARGLEFERTDGSVASDVGAANTVFPRFRFPVGSVGDIWDGYRVLSDQQIEELAKNIVSEIKARGPFLSLGEFVNRRVDGSDLGLAGALQSAIDKTGLNAGAGQEAFSTSAYPADSKDNIVPNDTAVGIPGWLTQADVLKSISPVITVRSDTFTIRSYGESLDEAGNVIASTVIEATVQRLPEFVDEADSPYTVSSELKPVNSKFGRRFNIVSIKTLTAAEVAKLTL